MGTKRSKVEKHKNQRVRETTGNFPKKELTS